MSHASSSLTATGQQAGQKSEHTPVAVRQPRIAVLVVAYNAITTLGRTLDRIPPDMMNRIEEICIFDDHSTDHTYDVALNYKRVKAMDKLTIVRNERNLRYGGNQKRGYRYIIDRGYDVVVLLHGDGQYAPEVMDDLLKPLDRGEADMVMGSRMMPGADPLAGHMPLYKYAGNKILTACENAILGTSLHEFHSGYRAYSCHALAQIPFERCSNEWHFDTEIIIQFLAKPFRIVERSIPTYYGSEICRVNGMAYAYRCLEAALKYRVHHMGIRPTKVFDVHGSTDHV
jgi:glycosyltransferase involved in cell wall biosynthesis